MTTYLEKFNSTVKQRQTEQIFKLLNKQRNIGQIRTVEEFTQKLDELVRELTQAELVPTLKPIPAEPGDLIDSDSYNHNLERVEDDLTAAFAEAHDIGQVQVAHEAIVRDIILKNIRHGLSELESKISLYEFLNGDPNSYTTAIYSTFRESKDERLSRGTAATSDLFRDPKLGSSTRGMQTDAVLDPIGERLVLGFTSANHVSIRSVVQLFDSDTTRTFQQVARPGSSIANILDETVGTYWSQAILTDVGAHAEITVKMELNLAGVRSVNFVDIEPAHVFPFNLYKIYYADSANVVQLLQTPDVTIDRTMTHIFPTVTTNRLILEFVLDTKKRVSFIIVNGTPLIQQALEQPAIPTTPAAVDIADALNRTGAPPTRLPPSSRSRPTR